MPTAAARKAYLVHKMPHMAEPEIRRYVDATKDFSIAYLRELVVLTQCFGKPFEEAIERLKKMRQVQPKSDDATRGAFGFGG
jgi:hypothetical protein